MSKLINKQIGKSRIKLARTRRARVSRYEAEGSKSTTFSPSQVSGLTLWLEARNTGFSYSDGAQISDWNDLSGNARHFTQGTAADRPIFKTNSGKPYIEFSGGNQHMLRSNVSILDIVQGNEGTIFVMAWKPTAGKEVTNYICDAAAATNRLGAHLSDQSNTVIVDWGNQNLGTGRALFTEPANFNTGFKVIDISRLVNACSVVVDGVSLTQTQAMTDALDSGTGTFKLGAYTGSPDNLDRVSAILFYNRNLLASEFTSIRNYLNGFKP